MSNNAEIGGRRCKSWLLSDQVGSVVAVMQKINYKFNKKIIK